MIELFYSGPDMKSPRLSLLHLVIATTIASASVSALASVGSCFVPGECVDSLHVGSAVVADKEECLDLCESDQPRWSTKTIALY